MPRDEKPSLVDEQRFGAWLAKRQGRLGKPKGQGRKMLINSPWMADTKHHCALFVRRGRFGRYRDFKSGNAGSLVEFVSKIEGCSKQRARELICLPDGEPVTAVAKPKKRQPEAPAYSFELPAGCLRITPEPAEGESLAMSVARGWLINSRGITPHAQEAYLCTQDRKPPDHIENAKRQRLQGRILIPYRDAYGRLIYWTARSPDPDAKPKYLEPYLGEPPVVKEEAVFCPDWGFERHDLWVVEGWACARSLAECGLYALSTGGAQLYQEQLKVIASRHARPVLAFDNDDPGRLAAIRARRAFQRPCLHCEPPSGHDWNSAWLAYGTDQLLAYICRHTRPFDDLLEFQIVQRLSLQARRMLRPA